LKAKPCPQKCTVYLDNKGKVHREKKYGRCGRVNEGCYHADAGIINKQNSVLMRET